MPRLGRLDEIVKKGLQALQTDGDLAGFLELDDGRAKAVLVSPDDGSSSDLAVNALVLPPGFLNPAHSHRAGELLIALHGRGTVTIDEGPQLGITEGDVVFVPPMASHSLSASSEGPLLLLAVMAKPSNKTDKANID